MGLSPVTTVLEAAVVLSPVAALLVVGVAWCRRRWGYPWKRAALDSAFDVLALGALLPIIILTLLNPGSVGGVSLVPFADMASPAMTGMTGLYQNGGNIALFMPLGALLPLALGRRLAGFPRVLTVAGSVSVGVEVLQYVLDTGHVASVDDVLLNSVGALLGAGLTWPG